MEDKHLFTFKPDWKKSIITCGEPKSIIKIGNLEIHIDKVFTNEQKEHIKEYFGFEVKDMCEGE